MGVTLDLGLVGAFTGSTILIALTIAPLLLARNLLRRSARSIDVLLGGTGFLLIFVGCVAIWLDAFAIAHLNYLICNLLIATGFVLWGMSWIIGR